MNFSHLNLTHIFIAHQGGREKSLLFSYLLWNLCVQAANKNSNESEIIDERVERWQLMGIMRMLPSKIMPVKWSWLSVWKGKQTEKVSERVRWFFGAGARSWTWPCPRERLRITYEMKRPEWRRMSYEIEAWDPEICEGTLLRKSKLAAMGAFSSTLHVKLWTGIKGLNVRVECSNRKRYYTDKCF